MHGCGGIGQGFLEQIARAGEGRIGGLNLNTHAEFPPVAITAKTKASTNKKSRLPLRRQIGNLVDGIGDEVALRELF